LTFIRGLNLPEMQKILKQFAKETDIMDMKEEMMNDGIDGVMEDESYEEERYLLSC
jgi:charged multivesicular body protein 2A